MADGRGASLIAAPFTAMYEDGSINLQAVERQARAISTLLRAPEFGRWAA